PPRPPLPRSVRARTRHLVLRPRAVPGLAAGDAAGRAVPAFPPHRRSGDGTAAHPGAGLPAAGGRVVRALLHPVGLRAGDLCPARVPAAGAGFRPLPREKPVAPGPWFGARGLDDARLSPRGPLCRPPLVRRVPVAGGTA